MTKKDKRELEAFVQACLQECRSKHLLNLLEDDYLNPDYHLEITVTVQEVKAAAAALGITKIK